MLAFLLVACVAFGVMATFLTDPNVKKGCWIAFVIFLAILIVLVLLDVLNAGGMGGGWGWPWAHR